MDYKNTITKYTIWLHEEPSLICARIAHLIRQYGVDTRKALCVNVFPNEIDPTGGVIISENGQVYQFSFNREGMLIERAVIDEWLNITKSYMDHPRRDEILAGLAELGR